jgi:DNA adenine methylase
MKLVSPLRYPGGKAGLAPFLTDVLDLNDLRGVDYYEPYAGGAGAALGLLGDNVVNTISINDSDYRIYSFWSAILNEPNWFAEQIMTAQLNLAEWHHYREICLDPIRAY